MIAATVVLKDSQPLANQPYMNRTGLQFQLEGNCDLSSNNNNWAWLYEFFVVARLNFIGLFLL